MASLEITCVIKNDRSDPDKCIQSVGGSGSGGFHYWLADAIRMIELGDHNFWTRGGGKTSKVVIAVSSRGNKYLRTESDGVLSDNLLHLPSCA